MLFRSILFNTVSALPLDLRSQDSIETALSKAIECLGAVDALVNNAGVPLPVAALDVTRADWDRIMSVNLTGTFFMTQAVGRYLMKTKRPGTIVSVASSHGVVGAAGQSPYGISKAAVMHMTRMLAIEWAGHGIRVNAVAPGKIETDSPARQANQIDPEKRARMMARIPARISPRRPASGSASSGRPNSRPIQAKVSIAAVTSSIRS